MAAPGNVANAELDALWDSVQKGAPSEAGAGAGAGDKNMSIGLRPGQTSFDVPGLREHGDGRILPEDGSYTKPGADPSEGGRYGPEWRDEQLTRQRILEENPDYAFIVLIAGKTNTVVERLYDDDSLAQAMRMRLAESQTRMRVQEVQQGREELQESLFQLEQQQTSDRMLLGHVAERMRSDSLLLILPVHVDAIKVYIAAHEKNMQRLAVGAVLESALISVPLAQGTLFDHATVGLLGGPASGVDDPDLGTAIQFTPRMIAHMAFADAATGVDTTGIAAVATTMREALTRLFARAFGTASMFTSGTVYVDDEPRSQRAPVIYRTALRRLLSFQVLASAESMGDEREHLLQSYAVAYAINTTEAARALVARVDGELLQTARDVSRAAALPSWMNELRALVNVVQTAHQMHDAESMLRSPRVVPTATSGRVDMDRTVTEIARAAAEDARSSALLSGANDAAASAAARIAARAVIANPPNHIFAVPEDTRALSRQAVERARALLEIGAALPVGTPILQVLVASGILGSTGMHADISLRVAVGDVAYRASIQDATPDAVWTDAMAWYESLGGSLFADRFSWSRNAEDGSHELDPGTAFPSSVVQRTTAHGIEEIELWGPFKSGPSRISNQMRVLWDRHVPVFDRAMRKISGASQEEEGTQSLTSAERVVYTWLSGGVAPEAAFTSVSEFGRTNWPIFVFMGRLVATDLAYVDSAVQERIQRREDLAVATRDRIDAIMRGTPRAAQPVAEPPYRHRRGWVERPENSGVVTLKPMVVAAIDEAWNQIRRTAPHISDGVGRNVEVLQQHPDMRGDFAELVAIHMSFVAQRFPKRYVQLGQRAHTRMDMLNVLHRFMHTYRIEPSPALLQPPGTAPQLRVEMQPVTQPIRNDNAPLFV